MKTKLFISLLAIMSLGLTCNAQISRKELTTGKFLMDNGFSDETARLVDIKGKTQHTIVPASNNKMINFLWKVDKYFDPLYADPYFGISNKIQFDNNETKPLPGVEKLFDDTARVIDKYKKQPKEEAPEIRPESL